MTDCIFCRIIKGEIPCDKVYEDKDLLAFNDINPAASTHILIIPKEHIPTLNDLSDDHEALAGKMLTVARKLAKESGVHASGYRTLVNTNADSGQEVFHLHMHVIGGRKLGKMA